MTSEVSAVSTPHLHLSSLRYITLGGLSWVALLAAPPALALQPLSTFVAGARRASTDDRTAAARANARAARSTVAATILDVEKQVARNYYQLVGAAALHAAGERTLQA